MQDVTLDAVEYVPAVHAVHVVAPLSMPVLVIFPAPQVEQSDCCVLPFSLWYVPTLQSVQDATLDAVEYFPPSHAVHVVAPVPVPASVMFPAAQVKQADEAAWFVRLW